MAPQASFFKRRDRTIALLDRTRDGSDARKNQSAYQMVPVRGSRDFQVAVSGGRAKVLATTQEFATLRFSPGNQPFLDIDASTPQEIDFTIEGLARPGRTAVVAEDAFGNRLDNLL